MFVPPAGASEHGSREMLQRFRTAPLSGWHTAGASATPPPGNSLPFLRSSHRSSGPGLLGLLLSGLLGLRKTQRDRLSINRSGL